MDPKTNKTIIKSINEDICYVSLETMPKYIGLSYKEFSSNLGNDHLSKYILEYYKLITLNEGFFVVGDSALNIYNGKFSYSPIKLFFKNGDCTNGVKNIYTNIKNNPKFVCQDRVFYTDSLETCQTPDNIYITFNFVSIIVDKNPIVRKRKVSLQISKKGFDSIDELLDSFKIDCCCIGWDNYNFHYNHRFVRSQQTKSNIINLDYLTDKNYILELVYYGTNGYTILFDEDKIYSVDKFPIFIIDYYNIILPCEIDLYKGMSEQDQNLVKPIEL